MLQRLRTRDVPVAPSERRGEPAAGRRDGAEAHRGEDPGGPGVPRVRLQQRLTFDVQREELTHAATVTTCQDE